VGRSATSDRSAITGEARGFQSRTESRGPQSPAEIVWTFRVERYDTDGNRLPPVPVEMRSDSFEGFINEGDVVAVPGRWREGQILHATTLRNITTGALVTARSGVNWLTVVKTLAALAILLGGWAVLAYGVSGGWRF
jgi:hypothetical protein